MAGQALTTALYIVIQSRGKWYVDFEGRAHGPHDTREAAALEARNQARVHLWYPDKRGLPYPELRCSAQGIDRFLTKNTQIGIRRSPAPDV